ncbi:hypothetical protein NEOKW01_1459 [Nematocida sp. AWRm80]|nr:hypothetical protein NEOKW01_1459 [Nematocida sp. AWRm80]
MNHRNSFNATQTQNNNPLSLEDFLQMYPFLRRFYQTEIYEGLTPHLVATPPAYSDVIGSGEGAESIEITPQPSTSFSGLHSSRLSIAGSRRMGRGPNARPNTTFTIAPPQYTEQNPHREAPAQSYDNPPNGSWAQPPPYSCDPITTDSLSLVNVPRSAINVVLCNDLYNDQSSNNYRMSRFIPPKDFINDQGAYFSTAVVSTVKYYLPVYPLIMLALLVVSAHLNIIFGGPSNIFPDTLASESEFLRSVLTLSYIALSIMAYTYAVVFLMGKYNYTGRHKVKFHAITYGAVFFVNLLIIEVFNQMVPIEAKQYILHVLKEAHILAPLMVILYIYLLCLIIHSIYIHYKNRRSSVLYTIFSLVWASVMIASIAVLVVLMSDIIIGLLQIRNITSIVS